jgi:propanediol dehydratase large subunit
MNEFYKSLSPETLQELAADGKIAATEILELAKSNDKLATMMDTTGVSAAALGHYYELLEDGIISAYEATTNFTKALSEMNAASNTIEDSFAFIDTFEPSRSQTEISEYFSDMRESAMELYEMGAYGDQQL